MSISNFPNGFANGVTIRDIPINIAQPGKVFWVNNSAIVPPGGMVGADISNGSYLRPFRTIAGGLSKCVANRGDMLMVMPGHAENVSSATGLLMNVAGVVVVGIGAGALRPVITLDTATTATIAVSAANMGFVNCIFKANFAAIVAVFTIGAAQEFLLSGCEFRDISAILNFVNIVDTDAVTNDADGLYIENCKRIGAGATANTCIVKMDGTNDRLTIRNNYFAHSAVTAAGLMPIATGKVVTNAVIDANTINLVGATGVSTGVIITTDGTTNSGMISRNFVQSLDATTVILVTAGSGFRYNQNYYSGSADLSGYLLPAVATP